MYCRFEVNYRTYNVKNGREFCAEAWEALWPLLAHGEKESCPSHFYSAEVVCTPEDAERVYAAWPEFNFTLKRFANNLWVGKETSLVYASLAKAEDVGRSVTHVHIPNVGLWSMNEVKLLDDACTDNLQDHLDEGWRILAVCPPSEQRRPDYILGRNKGYEASHR